MTRLRAAIINPNNKMVEADIGTILSLINNCENLHMLPKAGGILDQDSLFMHIYGWVTEVRAQRAELDKQRSKAPTTPRH